EHEEGPRLPAAAVESVPVLQRRLARGVGARPQRRCGAQPQRPTPATSTDAMTGFILRRLLYTIVVMVIASIAIFYALRVAPGDPVNAILNPTAMEQARAALRARLGLDLPVWQQYFVYVKH